MRYSLLQPIDMDYFTRQALECCIGRAIRSRYSLFSYEGGELHIDQLKAHGVGTSQREISTLERWLDVYVDISEHSVGFVDVNYGGRRGMAILQFDRGMKLRQGPPLAKPLSSRGWFNVRLGLSF